MADGTATFDYFYMISTNPNAKSKNNTVSALLPTVVMDKCCEDTVFKAYADLDDPTNEYKNDKAGFWWDLDSYYNAAELKIQKYVSGAWADQTVISNNTYGLFYDYGFHTVDNVSFIGMILNWVGILDDFGAGAYRMVCTATNVLGTTIDFPKDEYCLSAYSPQKVNGTVRLEWYLSGEIGDNINDSGIINYGDILPSSGGIYNQMRIKGHFSYKSSDYKQEFVRYNNGADDNVIFEQEPIYVLKTKQLPINQLDIIRTPFLMSNRKLITDYNNRNIDVYVKKEVNLKSNFAPEFAYLQNKKAPLELEFTQRINNHKKRR